MITASQTMIARTSAHEDERRAFAMMTAGVFALAVIAATFALATMWPPHALVDTSHEIQ